jgi:hypothetical protein
MNRENAHFCAFRSFNAIRCQFCHPFSGSRSLRTIIVPLWTSEIHRPRVSACVSCFGLNKITGTGIGEGLRLLAAMRISAVPRTCCCIFITPRSSVKCAPKIGARLLGRARERGCGLFARAYVRLVGWPMSLMVPLAQIERAHALSRYTTSTRRTSQSATRDRPLISLNSAPRTPPPVLPHVIQWTLYR